ncbi:hypothetical protein EW093_06370 [Thiospirochaeta perfilievii]|uniref:Uncharacterized protein n=1 Tax=Thiospirochaeta perfilievii TaxID=252967 RepID=A0A5C1QDR8_9SPIO|nr:hypothetical protein [Thiospirochaeta perfilievii]QEN04342.1 hypothetical protein EW093_06370 [Thiospirochaeta perfilievii]
MHLLLKESGNLVNKDKKYEIIKFGEDINEDTPSYNIVGLMVKDLNVMPPNFTGMRFPKKKYKAITLTMEEYMTSKEFENELHNNKDLENYFIIEYDLNEIIEYSKLLVTVYYPIKG